MPDESISKAIYSTSLICKMNDSQTAFSFFNSFFSLISQRAYLFSSFLKEKSKQKLILKKKSKQKWFFKGKSEQLTSFIWYGYYTIVTQLVAQFQNIQLPNISPHKCNESDWKSSCMPSTMTIIMHLQKKKNRPFSFSERNESVSLFDHRIHLETLTHWSFHSNKFFSSF